MKDNRTVVERRADRALAVTRGFDAPAAKVYAAWTSPALLKHWWAPKSMGLELVSCAVDAQTGGRYRFEFGRDGVSAMAFFGKYLEVVPNARLVWTNEESDEGAISTLTLQEEGGKTLLTLHETYPTTQARDESFEGMGGACPEQHAQLDALLASSP